MFTIRVVKLYDGSRLAAPDLFCPNGCDTLPQGERMGLVARPRRLGAGGLAMGIEQLDVNLAYVCHVKDGRIPELWEIPADQAAMNAFWS